MRRFVQFKTKSLTCFFVLASGVLFFIGKFLETLRLSYEQPVTLPTVGDLGNSLENSFYTKCLVDRTPLESS